MTKQSQGAPVTVRAVATFSAALGALGAYGDADAAVVPLLGTPSAQSIVAGQFSLSTAGGVIASVTHTGSVLFDTSTYQTRVDGYNGRPQTGRTITVTNTFISSGYAAIYAGLGIAALSEVGFGAPLGPGQGPGNATSAFRSFPLTTSAFIGFVTDGGRHGWLRVAFDWTNEQLTYVNGAIGDVGDLLRAGSFVAEDPPTSDVPVPPALPLMALGTLALGAAGLRKRRSERAQNAGPQA